MRFVRVAADSTSDGALLDSMKGPIWELIESLPNGGEVLDKSLAKGPLYEFIESMHDGTFWSSVGANLAQLIGSSIHHLAIFLTAHVADIGGIITIFTGLALMIPLFDRHKVLTRYFGAMAGLTIWAAMT